MALIKIDDDFPKLFLKGLFINIPFHTEVYILQSIKESFHYFDLIYSRILFLFMEWKNVEKIHHNKVIS